MSQINAFAERWVQTLQVECLDHFVLFGESHLNHIVSEFTAFYNTKRPHQSKENSPLQSMKIQDMPETSTEGKILCEKRLGGLINHYTARRRKPWLTAAGAKQASEGQESFRCGCSSKHAFTSPSMTHANFRCMSC
ncbi:MAG: integrase core domain-containing protein [Phycisphaerales bacterium]|nr:integrase core domain-containing protein [Phycisphaerales bacterium]